MAAGAVFILRQVHSRDNAKNDAVAGAAAGTIDTHARGGSYIIRSRTCEARLVRQVVNNLSRNT